MGHEGHGVHLCHRCGWPFPNPHPSAKQRRSHKKHCGTIEGYTLLIGAEAVSDEDHHADTDKEKSPSPKIEKKTSIGGSDGGDGVRASISRSEDEFFSDAVTEFPDSGTSQGGSAKKSLDKDLFYSFNDSGNGGHEGHGVHLCHRCGWPFPNPHPSAKQRRSHKKHCGTIEGYTLLIGAEAVSDEDHHADTDKEKSPSPKIEKKTSIGGSDGGDGVRASISRSEDEFFSDAVTEFPDSGTSQGGSAKKSLDKDLFYSFNDSGNGGTNEVLNAPIEVSKVDASPEVTEKLVTDLEKIEETEITTPHALSESKLELTETDEKCADGLIKDGVVDPTPEPIHVSQSQEAETIEAVKAAEEKVEESQTSEIITEEAKDSEVAKTTPDVSTTVEAVKESDVNHDKIELDHEVAPEVVKESEIKPRVEVVVEEIKNGKIESDCELVPEVTKQSETDQKVSVSIEKEDLDSSSRNSLDANWGSVSGTNEVLNAPIEVSKVDASPEVTEKLVTDLEKIEETEITTPHALSESKLELTETDEKCADGLIKDGVVDPTPEPIHVSQSQEAETIEAVKAAEEKVEESQTSEIITEEAKDSEVAKTTPDVSTTVGQDADNVKQDVCEKIESEAVKESEVNHDKIELDHEVAPEVVKESEIKPRVEVVVEEIKNGKIESDCELVPEVTKQSETDQKVSVSIEKEDLGEQIQEVVNKPDTVLTEKSDVDALESVKCSDEQIQEVVKEPDTVLTEKENPDAQDLKDEIQDSVKEPETIIAEKENLEEPKLEKQSNECTQEVLVDPDSIWTEKQDLDAPIVEKTLKENTPEETVLKSDSVLTEKENLDGPQLEKCAKENTHEVVEQKVDNENNVVGLVADVTAEKITPNASGVAPEQMSVDSSSRNSLDANWGSVSVLSTASVDAESTEKPKLNPTKPVTADCLVEPEVKDSKQEPSLEDIPKVDNESEAKKSTPLKNLLGEAKSPNANKTDHVAKKDEAVNDKEGDPMSPPKLIEDVKKGQKKVKGVRSWVPFACCSSVNVVN
ncbi:zinc finger, C2H2 [Artemisia annua]|uniref:Zinc finger, C2H2 n=1 Tax=Artemisia annua TaxID=35608 RepID=A0A2U1MFK7_ARTAN|nr:zinc finger, C2H2 [Artemisia annua]